MGHFFESDDFEGQLGRTLYAAMAGSADLGEAVATAGRITDGDHASWQREWTATAESVRAEAEASLAAGQHVSARDAFLRASEYHRQAFYWCRDDLASAELRAGYEAHREAFRAALPLLGADAAAVSIPYEGTTLNGYLFRPDASGTPRATVIAPAGYDSTAECGYVDSGYAALEHGYNCLSFEGPGQGGVLYDQGLVLRPDFEAVLTPVIDWLVAQPGVDPDALVVFGRSFAGYLAPRALTAEHRPAALICDPVQYDFGASMRAKMGDEVWKRLQDHDPTLEADLAPLAAAPARGKFFALRMASHGVTTLTDYFRVLSTFSMAGLADRIACPTLATRAEGDPADSGQLDEFAAALTCPVTTHVFTAAEGAGGHCEGLGQQRLNRVAYDWLGATLG